MNLCPTAPLHLLLHAASGFRGKIATILNCSVATIHTYRAQLRNAAIGDRNAFDDAIRRIDIAGAEPSQTA